MSRKSTRRGSPPVDPGYAEAYLQLLAESPLETLQKDNASHIVERWYRPNPPKAEETVVTVTPIHEPRAEEPPVAIPEEATWQEAVSALEELLYSSASASASEIRKLQERVSTLEAKLASTGKVSKAREEEERIDASVVELLSRIYPVKLTAPQIAEELNLVDLPRSNMLDRALRLAKEGRVVMVEPANTEAKRKYRRFQGAPPKES